jgi:hypothetical protein
MGRVAWIEKLYGRRKTQGGWRGAGQNRRRVAPVSKRFSRLSGKNEIFGVPRFFRG